MEGSILEFVGTELIGVMSPVSICMLLVVLLVYSLSPLPSSLFSTAAPTTIVTAANLVYAENPSDSTAQKLEGAVLNAVVFVLLVAAVTFLLVCLYYYNFTSFLKHYMRFSAFFVLATMGGAIFLSVIQRFSIPIDAPTCFLSLFNFTVIGVISIFGQGVPILVTQGYMVLLGIITAAWFTKLPEWTTWVLLVALAVYDLVAVLAPRGPLRILVELSQSRNDDLPALVYEARPTVRDSGGRRAASSLGLLVAGVSDNGSVELQAVSPRNSGNHPSDIGGRDGQRDEEDSETVIIGQGETSPLVPGPKERPSRRDLRSSSSSSSETSVVVNEETSPLVDLLGLVGGSGTMGAGDNDDDSEDTTSSRGIKLGLGDFVFYSVLVGRAALYDLMTVYACYLAIISGLACTLILLSVCRRALPALPISIALGVVFYFLTRLFMEPFVVGTSTNLLMF